MSRYPKPGSVIDSWGETYRGPVVVLANSRHRQRIFANHAREILNGVMQGHAIINIRREVWHSVTKSDVVNGFVPEEADEGGWAGDGSGSAWVEVAYPVFAPRFAAELVDDTTPKEGLQLNINDTRGDGEHFTTLHRPWHIEHTEWRQTIRDLARQINESGVEDIPPEYHY